MFRSLPRSRKTTLQSALALAALAAATAYRIWLLGRIPDQGFFGKYLVFADQLLAGDVPADRLADLSPAYFWSMVAFRAAGLDYFGIRAVQVILLSIGIGAVAALAWRRAGAVAGLGTGVILLLSRTALLNAAELEPETLIFLLVCFLLAFAGWPGPKRMPLAALAGLAAGLAVAMRPTHLLIAVAGTAWIFIDFEQRRWRAIAAYAAAASVPVIAFLLVNTALTGHRVLMNPGTVLHMGWNAEASGFSGVAPRTVTDVEICLHEPDAIHVAYRIVAGRALGTGEADPRTTNRYWTGLATAWVRAHPGASAALFARKLSGTVQSFEAWDLSTTERKSRQLGSLFVPFGFAFALALVGLFVQRSGFTLFASTLVACGIVVMVAFYVSGRQRNPILPPVAVLAGLGAAEITNRLRGERRRHGAALTGFVILTGALLSLPSNAAREHDYLWTAKFQSEELAGKAAVAARSGDREAAASLLAAAATWNPDLASRVEQSRLVALAGEMVRRGAPPERQFDLAHALLGAGRPNEAETILASLAPIDYRPVRENRGASSVALLRARAALAREDLPAARAFAAAAVTEAPGDPIALAAAAETTADASAAASLDRLHDPFTVRLARATVAADRGDRERAERHIENAARALPEAACRRDAWRQRTVMARAEPAGASDMIPAP